MMTPQEIDALADKIGDEHGTFGAWAEAESAAKAGILAGLEYQAKRVAELEAQLAAAVATPLPNCERCEGSGQVPTGMWEVPYTTCKTCLGSGIGEAK